MINLCIVGAADVIRDRHGAILKELKDEIRVRCIVSKRPEAVAVIEERLGYSVVRTESLDEALQMGIDAALVTVTPTATIEIASYLARLNIPQYVEKPLAHEVVAAAKFIEEVTEQQLPAIVGENFQHQKRFAVARKMYEECSHKKLTHVVVRDTLRRGMRTNIRTDDELFDEQYVHVNSAIRALTGKEVISIDSVTRHTVGSVDDLVITGKLTGDIPLEVHQTFTNTWSSDRYSLVFEDGDISTSHNYDHQRGTYTDVVEHWHGSDDLIEVENIRDAGCGMRECWKEFTHQMEIQGSQPSGSLIDALNDVQVREAIKLCMAKNTPIPIVNFS